jgi:hypothetical protein
MWDPEAKEIARSIDPECWESYSGKPWQVKRAMDRRREAALRQGQAQWEQMKAAEAESEGEEGFDKTVGEAIHRLEWFDAHLDEGGTYTRANVQEAMRHAATLVEEHRKLRKAAETVVSTHWHSVGSNSPQMSDRIAPGEALQAVKDASNALQALDQLLRGSVSAQAGEGTGGEPGRSEKLDRLCEALRPTVKGALVRQGNHRPGYTMSNWRANELARTAISAIVYSSHLENAFSDAEAAGRKAELVRLTPVFDALRKHHKQASDLGVVIFPAEGEGAEPVEIDMSDAYASSTLHDETVSAFWLQLPESPDSPENMKGGGNVE